MKNILCLVGIHKWIWVRRWYKWYQGGYFLICKHCGVEK